MPDASVSFTVKGPPERVFGLSNDLETLGSLIPDVTKVEIADEKNAYWHLTTKIGFVKHTTKLHTTITAMEPPKHADFEGDSDELVLGGSVELSPLPDGSTKVSCELLGPWQGTAQDNHRQPAGEPAREGGLRLRREPPEDAPGLIERGWGLRAGRRARTDAAMLA